jgi:hypothetical protein
VLKSLTLGYPVAIMLFVLGACSWLNSGLPKLFAEDPIFSGPQVGEKLPAFTVRGVLEPDAGKEIDFVTRAAGKPIVLIFVHEMSRPSIGFTRVLSGYTASRKSEGLATGVVWLDDDATAAENTIKRVKHALASDAPLGVSVDGREGPGSYGLNRKVALTILVGKEGKVTANFALVQPSLQADLPKVLEQVALVAGGPVPSLSDLPGMTEMKRGGNNALADDELRSLLRPLIQKDATAEQVKEAAKRIEETIAKRAEAQAQIGRIANTIVSSGKLTDYGTLPAQEQLRKWAKEFAPPPKSSP